MPLALWMLLWLNVRAGFRRMGRQAKTVRGVVFVVLGLFSVAFLVGRMLLVSSATSGVSPMAVRSAAPVAILVFCLLNLFASVGERAVTFSGAEIDFLFPGPFTRRQLLAYKLVKSGLGGVVSAMVFSRILIHSQGSYWNGVIGVWLTFQFIQMLAMVMALVQTTIGERMFTAGRRWLVLAVLAVAVVVVAPEVWARHEWTAGRIGTELRTSTAGRWLLAPFAVFGNAITADHLFPDGLQWDALGVAIDAALVGVVLLLDANYLETAADASARRYARRSRVRRVGLAGTANAGAAKLRLPQPPWLGGAGPVAWRQLTGVLRTGRGLLVILVLVACAGAGGVAHAGRDAQSLMSLVVISLGISVFLSTLLKFDFRGDLDHLDVLRSLPIRPTAIAVGELIAPALVLSCVQGLILVAAVVWGHVPPEWVGLAATLVVPVNLLLVGTENLFFLLFPSQQATAVAGDMGMFGKQSVVLMCRLIVLLLVAIIAAAAGVAAYVLAGRSLAVGTIAAGFVLACGVVGTVLLIGLVYDHFDPSVDTPT
jgi:hypothetical protein